MFLNLVFLFFFFLKKDIFLTGKINHEVKFMQSNFQMRG